MPGPTTSDTSAGPDAAGSDGTASDGEGSASPPPGRSQRRRAPTDVVALTVHGPDGVVDLVVPEAASMADVAREYASLAGLPHVQPLATSLGRSLEPDLTVEQAGVRSGTVLVVATPVPPDDRAARRRTEHATGADDADRGSALWFAVVAALAALAGWTAAGLPDSPRKDVVVGLLGGAGLLGCVPVGRWVRHRAVVAPALVGSAAFAVAWDPQPERLPTVLGVAALAAAVTAAVARALDRSAEEALRVWILAGSACFVLSAACALAGTRPQVVYALLVAVAMLAARFVPMLAVEVPDQYLIDLERLAVTAWSARERPTGRRGRIVVPRHAVATVAARGTRTVTAASAAVLVVTVVAAPLLLATAVLPLDRIGARCLVGFAGAALLLAARSFRHEAARALLRVAGIACLVVLAAALLPELGDLGQGWVAAASAGLAALLVVVAVALGRGWRSARWSRRAELAEGLAGAFALGSVVVAVGLFRHLWELTS